MAFSLKDYSGIEKIGAGGMGKVYRATQISLNRTVVIKEIAAAGLLKDPALIKRFETEAKSAASFDHDNIIRVYDFGEDNGFFYLVMEYVDGSDLEQLLAGKPFPKEIGMMIALQALRGLHYAHGQGVAHCDVKPGNILVSKNGKVKIADFGLARTIAWSTEIAGPETLFITPAYLPPEQAAGIKELDVPEDDWSETIPVATVPVLGIGQTVDADIWSSGVLLYRIVSGRLPFSGGNTASLMQAIVNQKEPDILQAVPTLPFDLAERIGACLAKDPRQRPTTLAPVIVALEKYLSDVGFSDFESAIRDHIADKSASAGEIEKILVSYHVRKGGEYLASGDSAMSAVHFEAAGNTESHEVKTQRIPVVDRKPVPAVKRLVTVAALIIIAFLCVGVSLSVAKKRYQNTTVTPLAIKATPAEAAISTPPPPKTDTVTARPHQQSPAPTEQPGILKLTVEPFRAKVYVDNIENSAFEELPKGKPLRPGAHTVTVQADGYESYQTTEEVTAGETLALSVALKPLGDSSSVLEVSSYPPSTVYIDGISYGISPRTLTLAAGKHFLILHCEGYETYSGPVVVTPEKTVTVQIQLDKE
jgi:eukaryotic-like serine/threonine-protein kinase